MLLIHNDRTDPYYNMAFEEYWFNRRDVECFFLWRNRPVVVVGKNQNTLAEIDMDFIRERGVGVVRRLSGGGAVYHDLGNINYTYIVNDGATEISFARFTGPITRALGELGVTGELGGRNDIQIDGRKISGTAQHMKNGRTLCHGTLLFSSDVSDISAALNVNKKKIASKGVQSVRGRVANISDYLASPMDVVAFKQYLEDHFRREYPGITVYEPTQEEQGDIERLAAEKYRTWDWVYGQSPVYTFHKSAYFPFGLVEVYLDVSAGGLIENAAVRGDYFGVEDSTGLSAMLVGKKHEYDTLCGLLGECGVGRFIAGASPAELMQVFI